MRDPSQMHPREALSLLERTRQVSRWEAEQLRNLLWKGGAVSRNSPLAPAMQKLVLLLKETPSEARH